MKGISVPQPWAWAILSGLQDVEYRCYPTDHRGDLLIHAAPGNDWDREQLAALGPDAPHWGDLPFGRIVGVVELWAVEPGTEGEWIWHLRDPRPVRAFAFRAGKRLFEVSGQFIHLLDGDAARTSRAGRRRKATAG